MGTLPPFEVAKAFAFHVALAHIEKHTGMSSRQLLGESRKAFIARQLQLEGGGTPGFTAVQNAVKKCSEQGWYPGKMFGQRTRRPPVFSERQRKAMARAAMDAKRKLVRPTPARVRAKLPRLSVNPETAAPASNWTIYKIMHTMCYDETEEDPWVYMHSPSKDYLCDEMKEHRVVFAKHVLDHVPARAWWTHVAIDPCITILASTDAQSEDQRIAAMGAMKMMSPKSRFVGANLRAPATAKTQGREEAKVHWTPVFARGKVHLYVCDANAARQDPRLPARLNNSDDVGKFVRNVLPGILARMKRKYGWSRAPRTVVHDKASYFVTPRSQRLTAHFEEALRRSRLVSWLGDGDADCSWLAGRLGDVYLHETVIGHIRHGLDHRFPRCTAGETRNQFAIRMAKVEAFLNSDDFPSRAGGGLEALAQALHQRCARVVELEGGRLRT